MTHDYSHEIEISHFLKDYLTNTNSAEDVEWVAVQVGLDPRSSVEEVKKRIDSRLNSTINGQKYGI
jgi:hypothetical protein